MKKNSYKLIGFDLDGTITQHKSKLEDMNKKVIDRLISQYRCVIVGAGSCERIYKQLNSYPIDIIGNYGMQVSTITVDGISVVQNDRYEVDKDFFETAIVNLRKELGYTDFTGESVEFHNSGLVTFPLIGTKAKLEDKLKFDPQGEKRTRIYDKVAQVFKDFNCFIGGTSSFDIVVKKYDKCKALINYAKHICIDKKEILYVGDDFKKGGNDELVLLGGIDCVKVDDYKNLYSILEEKNIL